jgi:hypothetical protein
MVWVVSRLGLRPLLAFHLPIHHHLHKVTAPLELPNLRSRLHFRQSQEGSHEVDKEYVMALERKIDSPDDEHGVARNM